MPIAHSACSARPGGGYLRSLALRREALAIRRQIVYGLVMGWFLVLVPGFLYSCVPGRVDWLWAALIVVGWLHLVAAVIVPQALAWPQRAWMAVAHWQGQFAMTVMLTIIYFLLIWPAGILSRRRARGFMAWDEEPPKSQSAWQSIEQVAPAIAASGSGRRRSLPVLLAGIIGFFFRRGDYVVVLIVILLVVLGMLLYFVQSSALAPFIYTLF